VTDSGDMQDPRLRRVTRQIARHPANVNNPEPQEGYAQA
ncbi:uncharacterized protein METZ01_LOCUS294905, partial [marine metagenome]